MATSAPRPRASAAQGSAWGSLLAMVTITLLRHKPPPPRATRNDDSRPVSRRGVQLNARLGPLPAYVAHHRRGSKESRAFLRTPLRDRGWPHHGPSFRVSGPHNPARIFSASAREIPSTSVN